jgi:predicted Zn-dependent peptidase
VRPGAADYDAAIVANNLLGGMFTSRLNGTLRDDEGLTYGADSFFEHHQGASTWTASLGVNPENVEQALASTKREIGRLRSEPPDDGEVARSIAYTAGSYPIRARSKERLAEELLKAEWLGLGPEAVTQFGDRLRRQPPDAVRDVCADLGDPERLVVVIAGTLAP